MDFEKLTIEEAKKSPCKKRKVGAIIVSKKGEILSTGYNYNPLGEDCEDATGLTSEDVIHAEVSAISFLDYESIIEGAIIYVTHKPCENCQKAIDALNLKVILVEDFMKFDAGKPRYSLVPPIATRELAKVLTYGAKKYKPNNWQQVDDISRYEDALFRHLNAWQSGELVDAESGLSHLSHALTNIAFLIYFEDKNSSID